MAVSNRNMPPRPAGGGGANRTGASRNPSAGNMQRNAGGGNVQRGNIQRGGMDDRRMAGGGAGANRTGAGGVRQTGSRRDVTDKKTKVIYYSEQNFDQTSNPKTLTKIMLGTLVALIIYSAVCVLVPLSMNFWILDIVCFIFWAVYFVSGIVKRRMFPQMSYKEASNYWTYEFTEEYKNRNVVLNDFKQLLSELVDRTTLIDDVSVEMVSYNPLIFEFSIRSSKATKQTVLSRVGSWGSKFGCTEGNVTAIGNTAYRVVYPREGVWNVLAGKKISPADANGETHAPNIDANPIGLRTNTMEEVYINNASQHTIVTGNTGTGKSNMFNMILYNLFPTDAVILFFDKKGSVEAGAMEDRCWSISTNEQADAWAEAVSLEIQRRAEYLKQNRGKKFTSPENAVNDDDALPFTEEFPPIIIAVDECHQWLQPAEGFKKANNLDTFLVKVAEVGRFAGITLMVAAQSARNASIPEYIRTNAAQKIAFQTTEELAQAAIGAAAQYCGDVYPSKIPTAQGLSGGGVGQFCLNSGETEGRPIPVKGYYITSKQITNAAKQYSINKRSDLPVVQLAKAIYAKAREKNPRLPENIG